MNTIPLILTLLLTCPLLLSLLPVAAPADAATDKAALQTLRAALRGRWNLTGTDHCQWKGVVCNQRRRVIELHLPGVGFVGRLPSNVIGNLTELVFLSLRFNALTGTIPNDLASCVQLKYVYFQGNRLSGVIPTVIFQLKNVLRVNLAGNRFSGEIPKGFNRLTKLDTLYLDQNNLTGAIPDIKLVNLKQFNVSYNNLTGVIPSQFCTFPSSSFEGNNLSPCPEKISPPTPAPAPGATSHDHGDDEKDENGKKKKKELSGGVIAAIVIGSLLALLILSLIIFLLCCRKKSKQENGSRSITNIAGGASVSRQQRNADVEAVPAVAAVGATAAAAARTSKSGANKIDKKLVYIGKAPRLYDLDDLLRASAEVLGKGNYGTTYKAALDNGVAVAVKRLKDVAVTEEEFKVKMEEIGRLEHENLVGLRAYHCSQNERLLVYDYFPLGSLSALLHGNRGNGHTPLNWETRSTIALGAARGIAYIHSQNPTSSHGNIKLSNILLSNSYEARVSDVGLSQLATLTVSPNRIAGYRAPEVTDSRKISQKADVYSFGIFLLELLTGKAPTHTILNEVGVDLPRWVQSIVREAWPNEVFDPELLRYQNAAEDMNQLLQLALDCTAQYPDTRPSMTEIANRIEDICRNFSSSRPSQDVPGDITSHT